MNFLEGLEELWWPALPLIEMQEIINRINKLSLNNNEEELEQLLSELKTSLIKNPDNISRAVLNESFLQSLNLWLELDSLSSLCLDILDISLTHYKIVDSGSFGIIELLLKAEKLVVFGIRKLQHDCTLINALIVPKSTVFQLINCLGSSNANVGPPSIQLLTLFLHGGFLEDIDIKHRLATLLNNNSSSEVRCRLFETAVGIAAKDYESFVRVQFILEAAVNDLKGTKDVLYQLNLLEILQSICTTEYGLAWLESNHVLRSLAVEIERANEDPLIALMIPGLMKFFASIARMYPKKIFENYSSLFDLLFNCIMENQSSLIYSALDTIGFLSKSDECKKLMDNLGYKFPHVLSHIYCNISQQYPSDVKVRALNCLENVFLVDDQEMLNNQIISICEKWCHSIFGQANDFSTLLSYCKSPFEDIAIAALGFLKVLVIFPFGQKAIADSAGFIEFLLDRRVSASFELKHAKYAAVEILSRSTVFDGTTIAQFSKYVRDGVNFVEPVSEVSFEPV